MTIFDETAAGSEYPGPLQTSERSRRQRIGVLLTAYGAVEAAFLGWMSLIAMQGLNESQPWLVPTVVALSVPCCVAVVGLGLARDRRWAFWAALVLPIAIVPFGSGGSSTRMADPTRAGCWSSSFRSASAPSLRSAPWS